MIEVIKDNIGESIPLNNMHNRNDGASIRSADPATLYSFVDGEGTVGFIPSITEPFCSSCNRSRLISDSKLLTCLFEKSGYDLRNMVRERQAEHEIIRQLIANVKKKPEGIIKTIKVSKLKRQPNMMHRIGG
jgi:cyclic pyranopterin phosphate synthase